MMKSTSTQAVKRFTHNSPAIPEPPYYLYNGYEISLAEIQEAFENNKCRIVCSRHFNGTSRALDISGKDFDTRGSCFSMREEQWTVKPSSLFEALKAAK